MTYIDNSCVFLSCTSSRFDILNLEISEAFIRNVEAVQGRAVHGRKGLADTFILALPQSGQNPTEVTGGFGRPSNALMVKVKYPILYSEGM